MLFDHDGGHGGWRVTAFRDRTEKEIRDNVVSRLENGKWSESTPLHDDNWGVYACPVNGPALSARGREVVAAWFTVKNDQGAGVGGILERFGPYLGSPYPIG